MPEKIDLDQLMPCPLCEKKGDQGNECQICGGKGNVSFRGLLETLEREAVSIQNAIGGDLLANVQMLRDKLEGRGPRHAPEE